MDKPKKVAHPSEDSTDRFQVDRLLRDHGFRIAHRPASGEAVWERWQVEFSQSEALQTIPSGEVQTALQIERRWHGLS